MKNKQRKFKHCGLPERVWINALTTYDPVSDSSGGFFDPCFKVRPDESVLTGVDLLVGAVCSGPDACDLHKANACLVVRDFFQQLAGMQHAAIEHKTAIGQSSVEGKAVQIGRIQKICARRFKIVAALLDPRWNFRNKSKVWAKFMRGGF